MDNGNTKQILLEVANDDQLQIVEAFIQEHKLKAFRVTDSKADTNDVFNDLVRLLIPIV